MPGVIVINPQVFKDKRDAFAVVVDEALRLWMEDNEFSPEFDVTPEQEAFFADTPYAEGGGTSAEKGGDVGLGMSEPATGEYTPSAVPDYEAEISRRMEVANPPVKEKRGNVDLGKLDSSTWGTPDPSQPILRAQTKDERMAHDRVPNTPLSHPSLQSELRGIVDAGPATGNDFLDNVTAEIGVLKTFGGPLAAAAGAGVPIGTRRFIGGDESKGWNKGMGDLVKTAGATTGNPKLTAKGDTKAPTQLFHQEKTLPWKKTRGLMASKSLIEAKVNEHKGGTFYRLNDRVAGRDMSISFHRGKHGDTPVTDMSFLRGHTIETTGDAGMSSASVFSRVLSVADSYIEKNPGEILYFSGFNDSGNNSRGRVSLYETLARKAVNSGYYEAALVLKSDFFGKFYLVPHGKMAEAQAAAAASVSFGESAFSIIRPGDRVGKKAK